jgi:lysyl-tRNA synthetase class 2
MSALPPSFNPSQEHHVRVEKLKKLRACGIEPWPNFEKVSHTTAELRQCSPQEPSDEPTPSYSIAGRLIARRGHGKSSFVVIQDRSGTFQLYLKKDLLADGMFDTFSELIDVGDHIWCSGRLFTTKTGELTLEAHSWKLLSKCLYPLPEKFHGLTNTEQRYRQRYLDLISNQESTEKFMQRSRAVQAIRSFLAGKDFMEVETPMLHPIPGGAAARPFTTHHNAYDIDLYLRIAPELYLKRLVVGGMERVFEINRNFRNEGVSTRHNPEFTMLEFYMAHGDYTDGIALTEQLIAHALKSATNKTTIHFAGQEISFEAPFARYTMHESLSSIGGLAADAVTPETIDATMAQHNVTTANSQASYGEKIFALFEELVESKIVQPTFIIGYPIEVSPLAKRDPDNPTLAARFELFVAGMELANGFTELNDPFDQAARFKDQVAARDAGDGEAHHYDEDYVHALEYGLPPTVGVGLGIDRLAMIMTNTTSIKDVILFPTMKTKHVGEDVGEEKIPAADDSTV